MSRQAEIIQLRETIRAQEAWGKFSACSANQLAQLEAEERVGRWGFDPVGPVTWAFALACCVAFWLGLGMSIWRFAEPLIRGMIGHG